MNATAQRDARPPLSSSGDLRQHFKEVNNVIRCAENYLTEKNKRRQSLEKLRENLGKSRRRESLELTPSFSRTATSPFATPHRSPFSRSSQNFSFSFSSKSPRVPPPHFRSRQSPFNSSRQSPFNSGRSPGTRTFNFTSPHSDHTSISTSGEDCLKSLPKFKSDQEEREYFEACISSELRSRINGKSYGWLCQEFSRQSEIHQTQISDPVEADTLQSIEEGFGQIGFGEPEDACGVGGEEISIVHGSSGQGATPSQNKDISADWDTVTHMASDKTDEAYCNRLNLSANTPKVPTSQSSLRVNVVTEDESDSDCQIQTTICDDDISPKINRSNSDDACSNLCRPDAASLDHSSDRASKGVSSQGTKGQNNPSNAPPSTPRLAWTAYSREFPRTPGSASSRNSSDQKALSDVDRRTAELVVVVVDGRAWVSMVRLQAICPRTAKAGPEFGVTCARSWLVITQTELVTLKASKTEYDLNRLFWC